MTLKASKVTVPFSHFYDWKQEGKKKKNQQNRINFAGNQTWGQKSLPDLF